jgi:hypothetical protein
LDIKRHALPAIGIRLQAQACEQLRLAESHLARQGADRHEGVHQARKSLRLTRAVLALGSARLGAQADRIDTELGRICRGLSWLRDRHALIEAIQRLQEDADAELRATLREALSLALKSRDRALDRALARDPEFMSRRRRLLAMIARLSDLPWQDVGKEDVGKAIRRSRKRLEKARRRARRHPERNECWHVYRRRLRRLRQQHSLLAEIQPGAHRPMHGLADQARVLGESQDDILILRFCGRGSPFPPTLRAVLRGLARTRVSMVRRD